MKAMVIAVALAPAMMHFDDVPRAAPVANLEKPQAVDAYFAWRRTPEGRKLGERRPE